MPTKEEQSTVEEALLLWEVNSAGTLRFAAAPFSSTPVGRDSSKKMSLKTIWLPSWARPFLLPKMPTWYFQRTRDAATDSWAIRLTFVTAWKASQGVSALATHVHTRRRAQPSRRRPIHHQEAHHVSQVRDLLRSRLVHRPDLQHELQHRVQLDHQRLHPRRCPLDHRLPHQR